MSLRIAAAVLLTFVTCAHGADLRKCRGSDGRLVYSDAPCPEATDTVKHDKIKPSGDAGTSAAGETLLNQTDLRALQMQFLTAVSSLSGLRTAVVDYYLTNGTWPNHLLQLGFHPSSMTSSQIESVRISHYEGEIEAELNKSFGPGKKVVLTPKAVLGGSQVEWKCSSNVSSQLLLSREVRQFCEWSR